MSGEVEQREALAAFIDQAEMGHIPGANVTEHWTDRVAYAVMHSDWLRDYVAARVASAAAENAALRARLDEVRALVDDLSALTEGPGRAGTALWPDAARDAYSLAIEEAQGVLRAVLAAAHDEGSEQR